MYLNRKTSLLAAVAILFAPTIMYAANNSTLLAVKEESPLNVPLTCLECFMFMLLLVIGVLGNVLIQLVNISREKNRSERKKAGVAKMLLLLVTLSIPALNVFAEGTKAVKNAEFSIPDSVFGIATSDFYTILTVILLQFLVIIYLTVYINRFLHSLRNQPELIPAAREVIKKSWFWDNFNAAIPMEKEKDLLLNHNYDGIQELDNSLPPWWKYGFYVTIVFAVIYLYRFHVSHDGLSQQEEYAVEMQKGEEDKAAYLALSANNVDESTVTQFTDAANIAAGKELFVKTCSACHLADGGGNVGPNLTDEYWLHGGGIKDVFKSIKYGWQDKGMKSWKDDYSPIQIQQLASFVKSLKGTKPVTPKAPQGDLYIETTKAQPAIADSAKTKS